MESVSSPAVSKAAEKIRDGAIELKAAVVDQGSAAFQQCRESSEETIKAYPIRSVLIALGVGVALGALIARR